MELDYNVIASGSKGNAVRIENIMIDCGIPFNKMKDDLYKCDMLLLTHTHTDHIKAATFETIKKTFPRLKIYGNYEVAYTYNIDSVISEASFEHKGWKIYPYIGKHDVTVSYYSLHKDDMNILYATDTYLVENPHGFEYDYVFLESNYDEHKLDNLRQQFTKASYDPFAHAKRHYSTQQCKSFYYGNRRNKDSKLIELHQSSRFY